MITELMSAPLSSIKRKRALRSRRVPEGSTVLPAQMHREHGMFNSETDRRRPTGPCPVLR